MALGNAIPVRLTAEQRAKIKQLIEGTTIKESVVLRAAVKFMLDRFKTMPTDQARKELRDLTWLDSPDPPSRPPTKPANPSKRTGNARTLDGLKRLYPLGDPPAKQK